MKKIFTLIVTAAICLTGTAKTADEVINELEKDNGAMVIRFNQKTLETQMGKTGDNDLKQILKDIDNGCVVIIEGADKAKTDAFNSKTAELDETYEPIVTAFDGDDRVKVLGRTEGDTVKDVVVAVADGKNCVLVYFTGNIPKDKIGQLINNKTINF